jgi:hypothetical protein
MSDGPLVAIWCVVVGIIAAAVAAELGGDAGVRNMERSAIEAGVGQYNATTGEFEWRPAR